MRPGEPVVVDTSALYALISSNDRFHDTAEQTYERLLEAACELWTSSYVLVEFGAIVRNRLGFGALKVFYNSFGAAFQTVWVDERLHGQAWSEYEQTDGNGLSFVDWTVLLAARRLGAGIFTFDSGFRTHGAEVSP
jgi:predicted nucleic acid-binding protein